jgi:hypothetical protein
VAVSAGSSRRATRTATSSDPAPVLVLCLRLGLAVAPAADRLHAPWEGEALVIYTIEAYWPNATTEPYRQHSSHLADALEQALKLMHTGKHTTITVRTPDCLELIRLWGQPMPGGKNWP